MTRIKSNHCKLGPCMGCDHWRGVLTTPNCSAWPGDHDENNSVFADLSPEVWGSNQWVKKQTSKQAQQTQEIPVQGWKTNTKNTHLAEQSYPVALFLIKRLYPWYSFVAEEYSTFQVAIQEPQTSPQLSVGKWSIMVSSIQKKCCIPFISSNNLIVGTRKICVNQHISHDFTLTWNLRPASIATNLGWLHHS